MILYAVPVSTYSAKVRIALAVKGIPYDLVPPPGGYGSPTYMAIVPTGTIPALQDGDMCLSESDVLIEYLEEKYPRPSLLTGDPALRARQRYLSRFHDLWLEPNYRGLFKYVDPSKRDVSAVNQLLDTYQQRLDQLEALIDPRPFMITATLGMADCAFPGTFTSADIVLPLFGRTVRYGPKLQAWRATAYAHPAIKAVTDECAEATVQWMKG